MLKKLVIYFFSCCFVVLNDSEESYLFIMFVNLLFGRCLRPGYPLQVLIPLRCIPGFSLLSLTQAPY
jgi:hypothetical protein